MLTLRCLTLTVFAVTAAPCSAAPLLVTSFDTRAGGTVGVVPTPTLDGNGSLRLTTDSAVAGSGQAKAGVLLFLPGGSPLGRLGDLTSASFDFYKSGTSTTPANSAPAVRFYLSPSFSQPALVWERAYQNVDQTTPTDVWQDDVSLVGPSDLLWQRANGQNFDGFPNFQPLSAWVNGFTPGGGTTLSGDTLVYGVGISFGSGIGGRFDANVDDVRLTFSTGATYTADFAATPVPEPATLAALGLTAACGGLYARRRRAAV